MISKYEYIELVFENCNTVKIKPEFVISLLITGIKEDITINTLGQLVSNFSCEHFRIGLINEAVYIPTSIVGDSFGKHVAVYKDITHVYIIDSLKKEYYISIPWKSDSLYGPNKLQKNIYNKDTFYIECSN